MKLEIHPRVIANFFLDGAKIIFGSLVVGAFMPTANLSGFPFITFVGGAIATSVFFVTANVAAHQEDAIKSNKFIK